MSESKNPSHRAGNGWHRRRPRLNLLPRPPGAGRTRFQWGLDRQPDRVGAIPPLIHRRCVRCTVLCLAQNLQFLQDLRTRRYLCRAPDQDGLQIHLLDRRRPGVGRARIPLHYAVVLLKEIP